MTRLAKELRERVAILKPTQTVNDDGGFDRGYIVISNIWAGVKPIAQASRDIANFAAYIRGTQVASVATHKMKCRRVAVREVGASYSSGFNKGFVIEGVLNILKSEYYVLRLRGGTGSAFTAGYTVGFDQVEGLVGNLFRILGGVDNNSDHEYLEIRLKEVEEKGTGAAA